MPLHMGVSVYSPTELDPILSLFRADRKYSMGHPHLINVLAELNFPNILQHDSFVGLDGQ